MFEEDFPIPGVKNPTENILMWQIVFFVIFASWAFGGAMSWVPPFLIATGSIGLILLKMHSSGDLMKSRKWRHYFLWMLPVFYEIVTFCWGLSQSPFKSIELAGQHFTQFEGISTLYPVNSVPEEAWAPMALKCSIYITALNLLFITETHFMIRRVLIILSINAAALALFGYVQSLTKTPKILGFITPPNDSFFATFTHPSHWEAFSLLWVAIYFGTILHLRRRKTWGTLMAKWGVWFITGLVILASTFIVFPSPLYTWLFSIILLTIAIHSCRERLKLLKFRRRKTRLKLQATLFIIIGILCFGGGTFYLIESTGRAFIDKEAFSLVPHVGLSVEQRIAVLRDSITAFLDNPIFGWGYGSFPYVLAFYSNADIADTFFISAQSDLVQMLLERGIAGTLIWAIIPAILLIKFLRFPYQREYTLSIWGACALALIVGIFDFPFQNPAFQLSFWLILFMGYRWSEIAIRPTPVHKKGPALVFSAADMAEAHAKVEEEAAPHLIEPNVRHEPKRKPLPPKHHKHGPGHKHGHHGPKAPSESPKKPARKKPRGPNSRPQ